MKRIYTAESIVQVTHMQNLLEASGIRTELRNQRLTGVVGEIPFLETWPELWAEEADVSRAREFVAKALDETAAGTAWSCPACGERIEGQFTACWNCGTDRQADPA